MPVDTRPPFLVHNVLMSLHRAAWYVVGLLAIAAAGLILASILGVNVAPLAIGTGIGTIVAFAAAAGLQEQHDRKLLAETMMLQRLERVKEQERRSERASLNPDCRELLERAEDAAAAIMNSDARSQNLLNTYVDEELLRDNIRNIEMVAKKITDLRAKHRSITAMSATEPDAQAGPMTDAVIGPQRRAIETVLSFAKSRVENLERYAASIKGVDATHRDWIGAQRAEGLNEGVRDLLANTVKDELAVEELRMLTERTAQAREAFQKSVREANLAAEILALPDDKDS